MLFPVKAENRTEVFSASVLFSVFFYSFPASGSVFASR